MIDDTDIIFLKPPSTISIFDDKYTILYQYVNYYKLPLQFFTLKHNKVYSIYDLFENFKYYDTYFDPHDILMIYYEKLNDIDLAGYKDWVIRGRYKIPKKNLIEYESKDLLEWYNDNYKKYNKELSLFFKSNDTIYYTENIELLLKSFSKTGDLKILENLITAEDYDQIKFTKKITPKEDMLNKLNKFKNKYENHITYDSKSFMDVYNEWIIHTHESYINDLKDYNNIIVIHNGLKTKNLPLASPAYLTTLVEIYNPYMINRRNIPIDILDGLDMFNKVQLTSSTPYLLYKDYNDKSYYKIYKYNQDNLENHALNKNVLYYRDIRDGKLNAEITYDLNINAYNINIINIKNKNIDLIIPDIELDKAVDYSIAGMTYLWDIEYNENDLLYNILTTSMNQVFFSVDYLKNITKKSIFLKYIPYNTDVVISIELTQLYYNEDQYVEYMEDDETNKIKLKMGKRKYIPYVQVKYKNVYNYKTFMIMIKSLLNLFKSQMDDINSLLSKIEFKKEKEIDENLKKLKNIAPDAFVEGYANFCDAKKRPTPIEKEDIKAYIKEKSKEFSFKPGELEKFKKQGVMEFKLANDETIHLACNYPNDKYPYLKSTLAAKKFNNLDKEYYTELPCCKGLPPKLEKITKKEGTHIMGLNIITTPMTTGELNPNVKYFLQHYDNSYDNNFIRLGVINDKNSFLHCLCLAMNDENYMNTKDKSVYVEKLLIDIVNDIHMGLLKQELYDKSLEEIKEMLLNNKYLDPNLYYRAFEEYYQINIYVLNAKSEDIMDLPRFNMFHARPYRNRKTVLIYNQLVQCELVINHMIRLFDEPMASYCHDFLQKKINTLTITQTDNYNNLYTYADHLSFLSSNPPTKQYIDSMGKLRALTFELNKESLTLITIPSQPENLTMDNTLAYCSIETALKTMTHKPTSVSMLDGEVIGLWFNIYDLKNGEYIPVKAAKNKNLPTIVTPPPSIITLVDEPKNDYAKVKRILNFILQVIQWLYILSVYQYNIVNSIDDFFDTLITIDEQDQSIYDNVLKMNRRFPIYENFDDYVDYISSYFPIKDEKIVMYNETFYNQIKNQLIYYDMTFHQTPLLINQYYEYPDNFSNQADTLLFLSLDDLRAWEHLNTQIKVEHDIYYTIYPYIYQHQEQKFIVQHVKNESFDEVMTLCDVWMNKKQNLGFEVKGVKIDKTPTVYKLNGTKIELIEKGNLNYTILNYDYRLDRPGKYAALLRI